MVDSVSSNLDFQRYPKITDRSKAVLLLWILFVIYASCFHAFLSVYCSLVLTCWERANLSALLYMMFSSVLSLLGQVKNLIVSTPDLFLLPYFHNSKLVYD